MHLKIVSFSCLTGLYTIQLIPQLSFPLKPYFSLRKPCSWNPRKPGFFNETPGLIVIIDYQDLSGQRDQSPGFENTRVFKSLRRAPL